MKVAEQTWGMHVDFISQRSSAVEDARKLSGKSEVIILTNSNNEKLSGLDSEDMSYVTYGNFDLLTKKMALTFGNLAAIVVPPHLFSSSLHAGDMRRIRQLTSAEGALVIWDELENDMNVDKYKSFALPDITLAKKLSDINPWETEFVEQEIFKNKTYLKHGLEITNDSVVVDIGANIGLFTLFSKSVAPKSKVFSLEPSKVAFKVLEKNTLGHEGLKIFQMGVGSQTEEKAFTYYPGYSVISGFHANLREDLAVILAGEKFKETPSSDEVIHQRFQGKETYLTKVISLEDFIKNENLTRIDYLKIDAERSELEIVQSLGKKGWEIIQQVVVEVHGEANLSSLLGTLTAHGFKTTVDLGIKTPYETIYTLYGKK